MNGKASSVAFGGVMAALALVIMCLGGLIPVMTYVCPMVCLLILALVRRRCGNAMAWVWYAAAAFLSLLMAPDKEAAVLLTFLGYYPIVKPRLDALRCRALGWFFKIGLMSLSVAAAYAVLIWLLGMEAIAAEFRELGLVMGAVLWVLALLCLVGLDLMLSRLEKRMG